MPKLFVLNHCDLKQQGTSPTERMGFWTWKPLIFFHLMSNYYILIYPLIYARHLEGNKQDGLRLHEAYIQFFFLPFFLTDNPRPTNATSVEGKYKNSDYPRKVMKHLRNIYFLDFPGSYRINQGSASTCMSFVWCKVQHGNASELQFSIVLKKLSPFVSKNV